MATEGFLGFYIETRDYDATAAFWTALGYENVFTTDHSSGQFTHPAGGPYLFINEVPTGELMTHPILKVADHTKFAPKGIVNVTSAFEASHWGTMEAIAKDPDGRDIALSCPQ